MSFLYMCHIKNIYVHTNVGIIATLTHITFIGHDFWNSQATQISTVNKTICHINTLQLVS
jgi:hypothetical protein